MPPNNDTLPVKVARIETKLDLVIEEVIGEHARRLALLESAQASSTGRVLSSLSQLAGVAAVVITLAMAVGWRPL